MRTVEIGILLTLLVPLAAASQTAIKESSGLAAGSAGLVWSHNDGPNVGVKLQDRNLYGLDADGKVVRVATLNVRNSDWEDMASFVRGGKRFLLVADVGDNLKRRGENQLYVVEEPVGKEAPLAWRIRFRYPDHAHDCEAVAVDGERDRVLLVTKRDAVPQIFAVDLYDDGTVQTATFLGNLWPLRMAPVWSTLRHPLLAPFAHEPTAMDISPDGRKAAILTYQGVYIWRRKRAESWVRALGRQPDDFHSHSRWGQYEGVAFAPDGASLWISEEGEDGLQVVSVLP